jgi:hypothetical protein
LNAGMIGKVVYRTRPAIMYNDKISNSFGGGSKTPNPGHDGIRVVNLTPTHLYYQWMDKYLGRDGRVYVLFLGRGYSDDAWEVASEFGTSYENSACFVTPNKRLSLADAVGKKVIRSTPASCNYGADFSYTDSPITITAVNNKFIYINNSNIPGRTPHALPVEHWSDNWIEYNSKPTMLTFYPITKSKAEQAFENSMLRIAYLQEQLAMNRIEAAIREQAIREAIWIEQFRLLGNLSSVPNILDVKC